MWAQAGPAERAALSALALNLVLLAEGESGTRLAVVPVAALQD